MVFVKGQPAWNKGKKCPQTSGSRNGMFGKKRPELSARNKTKIQREAVRKYATNRVITPEMRKRWGKISREVKLRIGWWQKENNPFWKGGTAEVRNALALYSEYQHWRQKVMESRSARHVTR